MIKLQDWMTLAGFASTLVGGGVYIHDIKRDVVEVSRDYRQHVTTQQRKELYEEKWRLEDRLKRDPNDTESQRRLEMVEELIRENQTMQQQLKKEVN